MLRSKCRSPRCIQMHLYRQDPRGRKELESDIATVAATLGVFHVRQARDISADCPLAENGQGSLSDTGGCD